MSTNLMSKLYINEGLSIDPFLLPVYGAAQRERLNLKPLSSTDRLERCRIRSASTQTQNNELCMLCTYFHSCGQRTRLLSLMVGVAYTGTHKTCPPTAQKRLE